MCFAQRTLRELTVAVSITWLGPKEVCKDRPDPMAGFRPRVAPRELMLLIVLLGYVHIDNMKSTTADCSQNPR